MKKMCAILPEDVRHPGQRWHISPPDTEPILLALPAGDKKVRQDNPDGGVLPHDIFLLLYYQMGWYSTKASMASYDASPSL